LVFDLFLNTSEAGLMVLLLSWRVLRIVHGLYSSFELHHGAAHKAADEAKEATLDRVASQKQTQKTKAANHKSASGRGPTEVQAGGQWRPHNGVVAATPGMAQHVRENIGMGDAEIAEQTSTI
jgi:hypothetical protein